MEYLRKWVLFLILGTVIGTFLIGPVSATGFGDTVWYDRNCDGLQNDGHWLYDNIGTPGVTVDLFRSSDDFKLATLITRQYDPIIQPDFPTGYYFFYSHLVSGLDLFNPTNVYVKFSPPSGYTFSPMDQGADNELDSDVDNTGKTTSFVIPLATQDNSWDAGLCASPPPPTGDEGCTPGYWKNHLNSWTATGYMTTNDFDATFGTDYFNPNINLEVAINLGGGGFNKLARHGTAALLSAAHNDVNYPYTVAEVIAFVRANNVDPLVTANELGCSIPN